MTLTAGATLQNGKYVIQAVLHQTELGTTYRAYHVYLDQKVVLQTLNPPIDSSGQRSNFPLIRQQFMEGARQLAKHPSYHRLRAIDLFEEAIEGQNLPFVVLRLLPNQPPQKIGEWFATLPEPTQNGSAAVSPSRSVQKIAPSELPQPTAALRPSPKPVAVQELPQPVAPASAAQPEGRIDELAPSQDAAIPVPGERLRIVNDEQPAAPSPNSVLPKPPHSPAETAAIHPVAPAAVAMPLKSPAVTEPQPQNYSGHSVRVYVQPRRRFPQWGSGFALLNPFLLTALIAGALGAGMGFALRTQPTPQVRTPFNLRTGLFTREQSFPAEGNWPISETPAATAPEPTASQPIYSTEPALQYTQPIDPYPSSSYAPLPAAPATAAPRPAAPQEPIRNPPQAAPEPDSSASTPPAPAPISREAIRETAPVFKPAPVAPAPVAPPPVVTEAPAAPPAPAIDPQPAVSAPPPALPPRPKTIDQ